MTFQNQISNIFQISKVSGYHNLHTLIATIKEATIYCPVLILQRHQYFNWRNSQTGHFFTIYIDIYTRCCSSIYLDISYTFYVNKFTLNEICVSYHITV